MGSLCPATGADAIPTGSGSGAVASHSTLTGTSPADTSSCTWTTPPGRSSAISSRHDYTSNKYLSLLWLFLFQFFNALLDC